MPDQKQPQKKSTVDQASQGLAILRQLVKDSQDQQAAKAPASVPSSTMPVAPPPTPAGPPPVDTGSIGGLLSSLKDRLSYAIFGPSTPAAPVPPK